jgi:membrane protease YdiL (CAAX protease family)
MNAKLKTTLRAWPLIAAATIGLCFLTQAIAKLFGVHLPDQQNVEVVRQWLMHAFDSTKNLATCVFLLMQVLLLLPAVEEFIFRWLLFMLPMRIVAEKTGRSTADNRNPGPVGYSLAAVSSALFSAAHYIAQPFPDAAFIALFFFGLAQCWLYNRTERIWCSMLNHSLFNLTNLLLLLILPA